MSYVNPCFLVADDYYLGWVLAPFFFTVILPLLVLLIFYVDIVIVLIYTWHWGQLRAAYGVSLRNGAFHLMSAIWDVHSRLWHGKFLNIVIIISKYRKSGICQN